MRHVRIFNQEKIIVFDTFLQITEDFTQNQARSFTKNLSYHPGIHPEIYSAGLGIPEGGVIPYSPVTRDEGVIWGVNLARCADVRYHILDMALGEGNSTSQQLLAFLTVLSRTEGMSNFVTVKIAFQLSQSAAAMEL